jgi:alkanesulfonate monooxygenase SsuD/methylene tetrahydromethanopterin reductase-like flavin-dependent oxidoreductase (luciferase family)
VMAAGLGYRPQEFQAMGVDMGTRVGRLTEGVELIKRLWTEERVTHEGKYFQVTDAGAGIRPKQAPRPPVWLGGDVEAAVRRAARIADAWLGSPTADLATLAGHVAAFADERRKHGLPDDVACPMVRECFLGRDAGHARAVSRGPLLYKYSAYASWGHEDAAGEDFEAGFDDFAADRFIVGDAEKVRDDIQRLAEITGTDHIVARVQWPGLEQAEVIANIERLGRLVANLP